MSKTTQTLRSAVESSLDALQMVTFNEGFEACLEGLEELSNKMHNEGFTSSADVLIGAIKEMRGENV